MSQPLVYSEEINPLVRSYSTQDFKKNRREGISLTERDRKIQEFENYIKTHIGINTEEVDEGKQAVEEVIIQDESGQIYKFFYFIGRLNPPHTGHLKALEILVKMANDEGAIPLILLGSGPGSIRTMENPISFELKEQFIKRLLNERLPGSRFIIKKMTNPAGNVSKYIEDGLNMDPEVEDNLLNINSIDIKHIAGGKEEDESKLLFALRAAENTAKRLAPDAEVTASVQGIVAETTDGEIPMSATKVRKDAYRSFLDGSGFEIGVLNMEIFMVEILKKYIMRFYIQFFNIKIEKNK